MSTSISIPKKSKGDDDLNLSQSVGGTLYGTTPGGTRFIYSKTDILRYKHSPYAKTPPKNLNFIRGVTKGGNTAKKQLNANAKNTISSSQSDDVKVDDTTDDTLFKMD